MEILINDQVLDSAGLTLSELLYLMLLDLDVTADIIPELEKKNWLKKGHLTESSRQKLADVLNNTKKEPSTEERIEDLADSLMKIFPKGKKEGTPYYWKGNKKEIKDKLKKFFVYFGDTYDDTQILNAAKKYVESFNGSYRYMRLLKYFIWKNDRKIIEEGKVSVEQVSELASYIENEGEDNNMDNDWSAELR